MVKLVFLVVGIFMLVCVICGEVKIIDGIIG